MNEPQFHDKLVSFQTHLLNTLRSISGSEFPLIVADHWNLSSASSSYFPTPNFTILDTHVYRCFTGEDGKFSSEQHTKNMAEGTKSELGGESGKEAVSGRLIVGEWSGALQGYVARISCLGSAEELILPLL